MPEAVQQTITKKSDNKTKLAVTLLTYVLMFSFFVTLATSAYIIYSDYLQGASQLDQSITQIKAGYQESISYSLWNFDSQQIKTQLAGILNFPGVLNVYIETKEGLLHSAGDFEQGATQKHAFDLFFTSSERQYPLGVLNITLDYKGLYETLFYKALNILATQFIKTFSVSLFILFIFQRLVTHRLLSMSNWAKQFTINNLDYELMIERPSHNKNNKTDEIDAVVSAINIMRNSLKEDIKKREMTEKTLNKTQYKLSIAINNAELGFCEYSQKTDRFSGNEHFANHLELEPAQLEQLEHPIDWFKNLIMGDRTIEQRERINQLLHGHMERICTELSLSCGNDKVKHFDTTIQVSEWDDNGLPVAIVFCILDKTEQVNASKQAADLNFALEQKVTKRTEELTHEQVQSKAEIKKLQHQQASLIEQKQRQQDHQNIQPLQNALIRLQDLIKPSASDASNKDLNQAQELVSLLSQHLDASNHTKTKTFDVVNMIQQETEKYTVNSKSESEINLLLPFSLTLDSYEQILGYCFKRSLASIEHYFHHDFNSENLSIALALEDDHGIITLQYEHKSDIAINDDWLNPSSNNIIILKLCNSVLEELFDGSIILDIEVNKPLTIKMRFSINARN